MAGQKDIKDFTTYAGLSDNDFLLASKTDLGGSDASIKVGVLKEQIASDVKPAIQNGYWYVNGVNTGVQAKGMTPVFRRTEQGIEMKYEGEGDSAYFLLIPMDDLIVNFNDLTEEQKAGIKGETGLSAYELWAGQPENAGKSYHDYIGFNRQPATDAAAEAGMTMEAISQEATQLISETVSAGDAANTAAESVHSAIENARTATEEMILLKNSLIEATTGANAAAAYALEQGDYAAEEGGKAAEAVPRIELLEQIKIDGGFSENGELFLTSGGVVVGDPIPVGSGSGGSGGGGGSILRLINRGDASLGVPSGKPVVLQYTFTSVDSETGEPTGNGTAVYYVNNARVYTQSISQGNVDVDVTGYLSNGQNQVRIQVTDSYGATRSLNIRVEVVNLVLESSFDDSLAYSSDISFPYTPKGSGGKTIHFILNGVELDAVTTTATNRQLYYELPELAHGSHSLTVYATMESGGVEISSNILNFSIMYVQPGSTAVIISSSFNQTGAVQYDNIVIPFSVYNPAASTTQIQLKANDEVVSTQVVDRLQHLWSYRVPGYGELKLEIAAGNVVKEFNLTVTKSTIDSEAETEGLELFLSSNGRSNNEERPGVWEYENIEAVFSGFNFRTNGWIPDENNVTALRISQGASVYIPFKPFASDFKPEGKTIEIEFCVRNVEDFSTVAISCFSGDRGFKITPNNILFKSELSSVSAKFREEQIIRVSFVVESRLKNRIIYTCINGIASGAVQYAGNDNFTQPSPAGISIGSNECTVDVYTVRSYGTDLNFYQILGNYISDTALVSEKFAIYDRNQVYDSSGDITYSQLVDKLPCMTITGELPAFKGDRKTVAMSFENRRNPERSFTAGNVQLDVQGTSSQFYPRKNFKHKFKSGLTLSGTGEHVTKYALREGSIPVDTFCEKADFAESSGTHNTGMATYADTLLRTAGYLTPPQKTDAAVRTTVDGYPIAIFHKANDNSPAEFVGKYNFNNDKSTQETFGFDGADECWEFLNNTSDRCLFKSADFSGTGWLDDFEGRYPDGYDNPENLQILFAWIVSCIGNPVKFKNEAAQHFNINNLLSYYLITELFGMVDQRAKNQFLSSWGNEGSGEYKWYFILYDNDTCLGINNEGANVFPFNIEDQDMFGSGHAWNGWDSELWKLVKAAYAGELATMYKNMRQSGALSYNGAISVLNGEQAARWCEVVYNMDGIYKYIQPLIEDGNGTYLYALQGSRTDHRVWWLSNRFFYMDSKYNAGDFLNDFVTMRLYTPSQWEDVEPDADFALTLYKDSYVRVKYGSYIIEQRGQSGQTIEIQAPDIQFNDTETIIYGISSVKGVGDLSAKYPGTVDISQAKSLVELIVGSALPGYSNENLESVSTGSNKMLRVVDIQNCPKYTSPLDLSGCDNIEEVRALGSSISTVVLPEAGILTRMELPATITNLTLKNQLLLNSENLILEGIENIATLVLENMNGLEQLELVKSLLDQDTVKLNWVRLTGVEMADADLSVLLRLASMKGIDENGQNTNNAVITGWFHADSAMEGDIAVCRALYPELEITVGTTLEDPVTTFEIVSSQSQPLAGVVFTSNPLCEKADNTHYRIKAATGTVIHFTITADNHEALEGTYIVTETRTRRYSMIYIPSRQVIFKNAADNSLLEGVTVYIDGVTYTSDENGAMYIRKREAFTATAILENFGNASFSMGESGVDTLNTAVTVYPYVDVSIYAKDDKFKTVLGGAVVTFAGATGATDAYGKVIFKASKGTYAYSARYGNNDPVTGQVTVGTSDMNFFIQNVPVTKEELRPAPNGRAQMHFKVWNNTVISLTVSSSTPCIIYWGDGETTGTDPGVSVYTHTFTLPHDNESKILVEVGDCENATYICSTNKDGGMTAYWSIGNSKVSGLSFGGPSQGTVNNANRSLVYVGSDLFKNDGARTNFDYLFCYCIELLDCDAGLFDGLTGMVSFRNGFSETKKFSRDIDLSDCVNLEDLSCGFNNCGIKNAPKITGTKLTNVTWLFAGNTMNPIKRDIFPFRADGNFISVNTDYLFASLRAPFVELPDAINTYTGRPFRYAQIDYLVSYSEVPPSISYDGINDLSTPAIYVPDSAVDAYKSASNWSTVANKIFPMSQKPTV